MFSIIKELLELKTLIAIPSNSKYRSSGSEIPVSDVMHILKVIFFPQVKQDSSICNLKVTQSDH